MVCSPVFSHRPDQVATVARRVLAVCGCALVMSVAVRTGARQDPGGPAIAGTIVDRQTGAPVANAELTLASCSFPSLDGPLGWPFSEAGACVRGRASTRMRTAADGTFTFAVGRGQYILAVEAPGFVRQEYGQRTFPGNGWPLVVSADGGTHTLRMALSRTARVTGRVQDPRQRPLGNVPVEILRATYRHDGERVFDIVERTITDARGDYSLATLPPGEYYLAAGTSPGDGPTAAGDSNGYPHAYVFYPGVTDLRAATRVAVAAGESRTGADIAVVMERYRVTGRVWRADGTPFEGTGAVEVVFLRPGVQQRFSLHPAGTSIANGRFSIADLAPGNYLIRAVAGTLTSEPTQVAVVDEDVAGMDIRLPGTADTGPVIEGRWSVDGVRTRPSRHALSPCEEGLRASPLHVTYRWPVFTGEGPEPESPWFQEDGTFAFQHQASGQYRLHTLCPAADVYVKDARLDGVDVRGRRFTLEPSTRHVLELVFSRRAGSVDVSVTSSSETVAGSRVVIAPYDRGRLDLYQSGLADASGHVRFVGVTPGSYDVFAWYALEPYAYFDPDVLDRSIGSARSATVRESSRTAVTVPLSDR